jgi:hypothetical protein
MYLRVPNKWIPSNVHISYSIFPTTSMTKRYSLLYLIESNTIIDTHVLTPKMWKYQKKWGPITSFIFDTFSSLGWRWAERNPKEICEKMHHYCQIRSNSSCGWWPASATTSQNWRKLSQGLLLVSHYNFSVLLYTKRVLAQYLCTLFALLCSCSSVKFFLLWKPKCSCQARAPRFMCRSINAISLLPLLLLLLLPQEQPVCLSHL